MSAQTQLPRFDPQALKDGRLKVPASAMRFAADVTIGAAAEGTAPITVRARSGRPVDHWFWGRLVHDFAGMRRAADIQPFDYCHDDKEVVGNFDKADTSTGELVLTGVLIPFQQHDRASELIFKGGKGQPYQGSIYFDPIEGLLLEYVPEGFAAEVNGGQFEGPGVIARTWILRGCAVCPYGYDFDTSVQFSSNARELDVRITTGGIAMTFTNPGKQAANKGKLAKPAKPAAKPKTGKLADPPPAEEGKAEDDEVEDPTDTEEAEACECEGNEEEAALESEGGKQAAEEEEEGDAEKMSAAMAKLAKKYTTAFGAELGGQYLAAGLPFDQARGKFDKHLLKQVSDKDKIIADQAAMLNALRGEEEPVSGNAAPSGPAGKKPGAKNAAKLSHMGSLAKVAATFNL